MDHQHRKGLLFNYLMLIFVGGLIAFIFLLSIKSEAESAFILGFSKQRLLIFFTYGLFISLLGILIARMRLNKTFNQRINDLFQEFINKRVIYLLILLFCFFVLILILVLLWLISVSTNAVYLAYFDRIEPILWWILVLCFETVLLIRFYQYGITYKAIEKQGLINFLVILFLAMVIVTIIIITRVGITPDRYQWRGPGTPILAWQVLLSVILGFAVVKISGLITGKLLRFERIRSIRPSKLDLMIFMVLWGLSFFLWRAEPLNPTWFNPSLSPPNYEYYPYSDAADFDIPAYRFLIGIGFGANVRRPLLSAFLALGHLLLGNTYASIVDWQLFFYSIFPALLYLLARAINNRISGLMIAGLAIIREITALKLSGHIYVSNAKMIMSDFPTMLGILVSVYLASKWLANKESSGGWLLVTGGVIGLTMLIRLQVAVLLLVILVFILFKCSFQLKSVFRSSAYLILGTVIVVIPWLTRNYFVNDLFNFTDFSDPSQGGLIERRYLSGTDDPSLGYDSTLDFIQGNPSQVVKFVSAHFFHNQISTLLVLPSSASFVENINNLLNTQDYWKRPEKVFDRLFSAKSYVDSLPYWQERFDRFSTQSFLPMWVNLLLIVLGISTAWRRHRLAGVFPLFAFNGYLLVLSFFRISGWRFIMPVDWVGYLYFSIGLIQVITWVYNYFMNRQSEEPLWEVGGFPHQGKWFSRKSWIFIGLSFFFLSASIPLFEIIIPQKYAPESLDLLLQETRDQLIANNIEFDLENFLNQENSGVHLGLALYPRFDLAGKGHFDSQWESHLNRDFSRLGFLLQTSHDGLFHVVLPVERLPDSFPNGSDVIILACKKENFLLANMVKIMTGSDHKIFYSSAPEWDCT